VIEGEKVVLPAWKARKRERKSQGGSVLKEGAAIHAFQEIKVVGVADGPPSGKKKNKMVYSP